MQRIQPEIAKPKPKNAPGRGSTYTWPPVCLSGGDPPVAARGRSSFSTSPALPVMQDVRDADGARMHAHGWMQVTDTIFVQVDTGGQVGDFAVAT